MDILALSIMALLVLLLCLGMVLYFRDLQRRYYDLTSDAIGLVDEIRVRETRTFAADESLSRPSADAAPDDAPAGEEPSPPAPLTIEGSKVLRVGRPSSPFVVTGGLADGGGAGSRIRWELSPAGAGTLVRGDDDRSIRVIAAIQGVLRIDATAVTGAATPTQRGSFESVALAGRTGTLELPWVGQGIGSFVIATFVLGIALYLGYVGVLDGAVVATLLTAVAGYVFGLNAAASRS